MPSELAHLYEDMKNLRRRGEWQEKLSPGSGQAGNAQLDVMNLLTEILGIRYSAGSDQSTPITRLAEVCALTERVFGDAAKAQVWLSRPNASLSGQRPIDLLTDELGAAVVRETLERLDSGIFA